MVEEDIKKYITDALSSMSPPPSTDEIKQLAKHAGKLFIYAATAVRYIIPGDIPVDSGARLWTILETSSGLGNAPCSIKRYEELDTLYTGILSAALNHHFLEEEEKRVSQCVLWTAVCVQEPMTASTLALLLGLGTEPQVLIALKPLQSVLYVMEGVGLVSTLHASFPEYIFDQLRAKSFYCDRAQHSEFLADCCFNMMEEQLQFNICNLESSFLFDKEIVDLEQQIKSCISAALSYSCRYWGKHLQQGCATEVLHQKLINFLTNRLLFWMEVLNLEQCIALGAEILHSVHNWIVS